MLLFTGHDGLVPESLEPKCLMGPPITALSYDTPAVDVTLDVIRLFLINISILFHNISPINDKTFADVIRFQSYNVIVLKLYK